MSGVFCLFVLPDLKGAMEFNQTTHQLVATGNSFKAMIAFLSPQNDWVKIRCIRMPPNRITVISESNIERVSVVVTESAKIPVNL